VTPAQQRILDALMDFISDNGYPPTHSEITIKTGIRESSVNYSLRCLEDKGIIEVIRDVHGKSVSRGTYPTGLRDVCRRFAKTGGVKKQDRIRRSQNFYFGGTL
jgi:SOS-response transcriptional repressor LexA